MDKFALQELTAADLTTIEGIGPARAAAIDLSGPDWADMVLTFMNIVATKGLAARPLVCFTGADPGGNTRDWWVKLAEANGFTFHKSVTKGLALLVLADPNSGSTKAQKAKKYGTKVMSYQDFFNLTQEGKDGG